MTARRSSPPFIAALATMALAGPAQAGWNEQVGGESPINVSEATGATQPSLGESADTPYIAWAEPDDDGVRQIRVARLDGAGTAWERPADGPSPINVSATESAEDPTLRRNDPDDSPCVAFAEADGSASLIHMSCLNSATEWTTIGDSPNKDAAAVASQPSLALFDDITWVAWSETDSSNVNQIRVAKLPPPGSNWARVPDTANPVNAVSANDAFNPSLAVVGEDLHLAWGEITAGGVSQVRAAVLDEASGTWTHVGGVLNVDDDANAFEPSVADIGGVPHVAWSETNGFGHDQVRVKRLAGSSWEAVAPGSTINTSLTEDAGGPSLAEIAGVPYVAWSEPDANSGAGQVRVARLDPGGPTPAWEHVARSLNHEAARNATAPSLTSIGGFPYVGWAEVDDAAHNQVRVTRLEPEFVSEGAASVTDTAATLTAQVRTYGLAYPVGFAYGESVELETTPQPTPTGQGDVVPVSLPVSDLTPGTTYAMQPFATAGVPAPRVLGTTTNFTTLPVQRQLTVTVGGTGAGTVESTPAGIHCGVNTAGATACSHGFDDASTVTLEANAATGSAFRGFTGAGCGSSGVSCVVTMSQAQTVSASFEPKATPPNLTAPSTTISKHPKRKTRSTKATFRFSSSAPGSAFVCKLDRKRYRPCESPARYKRLKRGRHTFRVRATDASGRADPSPAKFRWRVRAARR